MRYTRAHTPGRARGFTLVEMLVSLLVLFVLMGLVVGGLHLTTSMAKTAADRQAVLSLKMAVDHFKQEYGFLPPVVRDQAVAPVTPASVEGVPGSTNSEKKIAIYRQGMSPAGFDVDSKFYQSSPVRPTPDNPFADNRYSERTLAYYLAGALGYRINSVSPVPIDGVTGPGFYPPNPDGTFVVPADLKGAGGTRRQNRTDGVSDSLVELSKRSPTIYTDPSDATAVELRDVHGVPIRYYRWLQGDPNNGNQIVNLADYNVPPLVGRAPGAIPTARANPDRDLDTNKKLRSAVYAVVAAGPDGAFGDEPVALLAQRLGKSAAALSSDPAELLRVRAAAEADNIVEVGE